MTNFYAKINYDEFRKDITMEIHNHLRTSLLTILIVSTSVVFGDNSVNNPRLRQQKTDNGKPADVQETPEDKAYRGEMLRLSNAIVQKISEIQAKQKELNEEVYPAYKPPLQGELDILNKQLEDLKLKKSQLEAQKTARDMSKQLNQQGQNSNTQK